MKNIKTYVQLEKKKYSQVALCKTQFAFELDVLKAKLYSAKTLILEECQFSLIKMKLKCNSNKNATTFSNFCSH